MAQTNDLAAQRRAAGLRSSTLAVTVAAARLVAAAQVRLRPADVRRKAVGDFVTAVDLRCERFLRRELARILPEAGFLGEETPPSELDRPWLWVVDPIDGTSNFSRRLVYHAVSVALLWRGQPMLACLHCEPEDATYSSVRGRGAWRNGRRISIPGSALDDAAIVGCQWHRGQQQFHFLARLQAKGSRVRTFGSTVTQLADVAMGRLDGNVQEQGRIWDIAAAGLVVLEAGGCFTDWRGAPVFPFRRLDIGHTPTVAAGPLVHRALLRQLKGCEPQLVVSTR